MPPGPGAVAGDPVDPLRSYVPRLAAEWLERHRHLRSTQVSGTLVSADISGFTALSEELAGLGRRGAEELTDLLNSCFDRMIDTCGRHGGDVIKFGGDALLVLFAGDDDGGGGDHAARACQAAVGMRSDIGRPLRTSAARTVRLSMSVGIGSGAFNFVLPHGSHRELFVLGPDVTATVRREAAAAAGEILIGEVTAALLPQGCVGERRDAGCLLRRAPAGRRSDAVAPLPPPGPVELDCLLPAAQRATIDTGGVGEHRQACIGFIRFAGVDELIAGGRADGVVDVVQQLSDAASQAVGRHGVHFLASDVYADGAKLILSAGVPVASVDDDERLLRAVRDIVDAAGNLPGLRLSAGVHRGAVFAGNLGCSVRRAYTVMGDTVNLAARLMQRAGTDEVLASQSVLARCRSSAHVVPLEPFLVKGKRALVNASSVLALTGDPADEMYRPFPLVGRDVELAQVVEAARRAVASEGSALEIVGEAGSGKTRLAAELQLVARQLGMRVICASCHPYATTTPYSAVTTLLRCALGIPPAADPRTAAVALAELVHGRAEDLAPLAPLIAVPLSADVPTTREVEEISPDFRRERMHAALVELLLRTVDHPLLMLLEDGQWADQASMSLLAALTRAIGSRAWFVCVTSHGPAPLLTSGDATLHLGALPAPDARALARVTPLGKEVPEAVLDQLLTRAGGNPLFVVELVAAYASGTVDVIPDTIDAVVTSRLDELDPPDRVLLRESSVLGTDLDLDLIAAVFGHAAASPQRWSRLGSLVQRAGPGRYHFAHDLFRQPIYEGLSYRRRRELHRRVAEAMRASHGDAEASLLALHYHLAEDHQSAWELSVVAGRNARTSYANLEACDLFTRALEHARHLPDLDRAEIADVAEALGDAAEASGQIERSADAYGLARRAAPRREPTRVARLLRKSGVLHERRGRYAQALQLYSHGRRMLAAAMPEAPELSELALAYAGVRDRQGLYAEARRWCDSVLESAGASRSQRAHALNLAHLVGTHQGGGDRSGALEALAIYEELGHVGGQAAVLNNLGIDAYYRGNWDEAADLYRRSVEANRRCGDLLSKAAGENNLAEILIDQGQLDDALALLDRALVTFGGAPYPFGIALNHLNRGKLLARAGDVDEGLRLMRRARDLFVDIRAASMVDEADVQVLEATVRAGRFTEGLAMAPELADHVTLRRGDPHLHVAVMRLHASALAATGQLREALSLLDESVRGAEAAGLTFELARSLATRAGITGDGADRARAEHLLGRLGVVGGVLQEG